MPTKQQLGRVGGLVSWSNTIDRTKRTENGRAAAPSGIDWHLSRLGPEFDDASDDVRLAAAEAARKAYFLRLALKSAAARSKRSAA